MDDFSQFKHLEEFLAPVSDDNPCGENLDSNGDEEYTRIEREIQKSQETRTWKALKKDTLKVLATTKDFRLLAYYSKILLHTEEHPIDGLTQGLYLTKEYIDKFWDCTYPPEDEDDPDEKYADRINAIGELGSWVNILLPLSKKCPVFIFEGFGEYSLEDLVAFKNGDTLEDKQSPKVFYEALPSDDKEKIDKSLDSFKNALELTTSIKELLLEKTKFSFTEFDSYLIPNLQDGISVLSELSPNSELEERINEENIDTQSDNSTSHGDISSVKSRDDVVRLLDLICAYYKEKEPSSPLPLLLDRAKSIVHKDFLEVLEELVPDSVSMTEPVFGRPNENEN